MSTYKIDEVIVKTENALQEWEETTDWDGRNAIPRATNDQWTHQTLYKSKKGRYYIEHTSQREGSRPYVEFIDKEEAAQWLLLMEHDLPEDLKKYKDAISE